MTNTKNLTRIDAEGRVIHIIPLPSSIVEGSREAYFYPTCRNCTYKHNHYANCLEQITLCTVFDCLFWDDRPVCDVPISDGAMKDIPERLIDRDWCADPANFKTPPKVSEENTRTHVSVREAAEILRR